MEVLSERRRVACLAGKAGFGTSLLARSVVTKASFKLVFKEAWLLRAKRSNPLEKLVRYQASTSPPFSPL
jgi:hypothetical protein